MYGKNLARCVFICVFICLFFILMLPIKAQATSDDITLIINGREITGLPVPPLLYQDSVLVPAREVFEYLGATVEWYAAERTVYINYEGHRLVMTIDQKTAFVNGEAMQMVIPPLIINGKTMIPLRFPSECFGFDVAWHGEERAAYIYTPLSGNDLLPENGNLPGNDHLSANDGLPADDNLINNETNNPSNNGTNSPTDNTNSGMDENLPIIPLPGNEPSETGSPGTAIHTPPVAMADNTDMLARDISQMDILPATFPETTVTALLTPRETQSAAYTIVSSSPMSEVQKFLLPDNRLVVDIYNATCGIWGPFYVDASCPVSGVRASQFMETPQVTRVVFDVIGAAEYSISLSADRTELTVSFTHNYITSVAFSSNGVSDAITITGTGTPVCSVYPLTNPDRIMIYIANATMMVMGSENTAGVYVTGMTSRQQDDGAGSVEASVRAFSSYEVVYGVNTATIRFYPSTYQNIAYDRVSRIISIPKSSGLTMDINQVQHYDDYPNLTYTLVLPTDAETSLGYGEFIVQDGYIHTVQIARDAQGYTQLIIKEAQVLAFRVTENDEYYFIKAYLPKELYPRVVVIDAGHGGADPGSIGLAAEEKEVNLNIALKLMMLLDDDPTIQAYATRLTDITFPREDRPIYANGIGDMFISIHANSAKNNNLANGIETWYWPHANDAAVGFSCYQLAQIMHKHLVAGTGATDRGLKSDELIVLRDTTIPAVLCETGFMSNAVEGAKLVNDAYQWQIAFALYNGICEAFSHYTPKR